MVFACVSMTARALGPKMAGKYNIFREIIEQMLGVGLSPALTAALADLAGIIPATKKPIQGLNFFFSFSLFSITKNYKPISYTF